MSKRELEMTSMEGGSEGASEGVNGKRARVGEDSEGVSVCVSEGVSESGAGKSCVICMESESAEKTIKDHQVSE